MKEREYNVKILVFILILFSFIAVTYLSYYFLFESGPPSEKAKQKKMMISYLNEKYHADFTIEMKYDIENKGVYAIASPKTNPDVKFEITSSHDGLLEYEDTYFDEYFKSKYETPVETYIFNLFPDLKRNQLIIGSICKKTMGSKMSLLRPINFDQRTTTLVICKNQDWNQKTEDEKNVELLKIQKLADYLEEYHLPVLVQILYETKDDKRHMTIYISREGKIIK